MDHARPFFWPVGVLSEEQIRLKKQKKQQEEETARSSTEVPATPPQEAPTLDPQQHEMIEKLVAMQKQCNKRSFLERPKVTVSVCRSLVPVGRGSPRASLWVYHVLSLSSQTVIIVICAPLLSTPVFFPILFHRKGKHYLCVFQFTLVSVCLKAVATESRPAEPRDASAAVCPLHRACDHVGPGDCGFCQAASWVLGAHQGRPDRSAEDVYDWGLSGFIWFLISSFCWASPLESNHIDPGIRLWRPSFIQVILS